MVGVKLEYNSVGELSKQIKITTGDTGLFVVDFSLVAGRVSGWIDAKVAKQIGHGGHSQNSERYRTCTLVKL